MQRIDEILNRSKLDILDPKFIFRYGPAEFLCRHTAEELKKVPQFAALFGDFIDGYKRMDYPFRAAPAMRIYNNTFDKEYDSWFIEGDLVMDLIFPASIRRLETQQIPDTVSSAIVQQFRRPDFFVTVCSLVPGLNELGKKVHVDKALAFSWGDEELPLTQITLNFRLDLRIWDDYLEENLLEKSSPFEETLGQLKVISGMIQGLQDEDIKVEIPMSQKI